MDLIFMYFFYVVKEFLFDEFFDFLELKIGVGFVLIKIKIFENLDFFLEFFKGYVNIMNFKGEKMLEMFESF